MVSGQELRFVFTLATYDVAQMSPQSYEEHSDIFLTWGVAINSFKQALHLAVAAAEYYEIVGIGEIRHMGVSSNLNPWVIL